MNRSITPRRAPFSARRWLATGAIALGAVASSAFTVASAQTPAPTPAQQQAPMNFQQIVDRVVSQGYTDIREVERESDKLYEVKARDGQGRRVELYVDGRSGEVLREKVKK